MGSLAARAEVVKLARELHVPAEDLAFLLDSDEAAVRRFRRGIHHALDAPHRPMFQLLARVSALIPNTLAVGIATRFFGPMLCGMMASSLSPERAVALIGHMPVEFLADAAPYVDPEAAAPIVKEFDTDVLVPVMAEMLRRKDFVTLARFLVSATDQQILDVVPHIESGADMLSVAFNAELDSVSDRFEPVLAALPEERIRAILEAAHDRDQFPEALTFLQFLSDKTLSRVADIAAGLGPDLLTHLVQSTHRENAWAELIPIAAAMSPEQLRILAALDVWGHDELTALLEAADRTDRWDDMRRIASAMDAETLNRVAATGFPGLEAHLSDLLDEA